MNLATILLGVILAFAVGLAIYQIRKNRKSGCSGCSGGSCKGCPYSKR